VISGLSAALIVEARKARSARVLWATGVLLLAGVTALAVSVLAAARSGGAVLAKLGPQAGSADWSGVLGTAAQVTAAGSVLAFGVGLSWVYGREFADGTVAGLYGLPVSREATAIAKSVIYLGWAVAVSFALAAALLVTGLIAGLGVPDAPAAIALCRQFALGVMSALIAAPAGLAASLGRGLLPGIGVAVAILVLAQVSVLVGDGGWIPFVAPAAWAMHPDASTATALALVPTIPILFGWLTVLSWRRMQLDR
jgi:ABC-2 type transport system permease protein